MNCPECPKYGRDVPNQIVERALLCADCRVDERRHANRLVRELDAVLARAVERNDTEDDAGPSALAFGGDSVAIKDALDVVAFRLSEGELTAVGASVRVNELLSGLPQEQADELELYYLDELEKRKPKVATTGQLLTEVRTAVQSEHQPKSDAPDAADEDTQEVALPPPPRVPSSGKKKPTK